MAMMASRSQPPLPETPLVRNLIFVNGTSNDDLGIDLDDDGVTANDADDVDTGANDLHNHPLITAVHVPAGTVAWTVDGLRAPAFPARVLRQPPSATPPGAERGSDTSAR